MQISNFTKTSNSDYEVKYKMKNILFNLLVFVIYLTIYFIIIGDLEKAKLCIELLEVFF